MPGESLALEAADLVPANAELNHAVAAHERPGTGAMPAWQLVLDASHKVRFPGTERMQDRLFLSSSR